MTNRVLWLLSYIGLSLALALGNRQTTLGGSRATEEHRAVLAASASSPATGGRLAYRLQDEPTTTRHTARNALHDWLVYDKRTGPESMLSADRLVLLDDVLSTVLGNFYRQQQRHRQLPSQGSSSSHPLSFLYDEEDDDEDDEADDDDDDDDDGDGGESRMMLRSSHERPLLDSSPAAMYVETLAPNRPRSGTGLVSDRTAVRRSLGTSESRGLGVGLSVPYNLEQPSVAPKPPGKRNSAARLDISKEAHQQQQQQQVPASAAVAAAGASMASQFMLRSARGNRQYDVPQIECPQSDDGMERFACPTADRMGRYRCIDDHVLCDGFIDCPTGEDEDRQACMFYKTTKAHLDVLADALLRWARGR